jgi:hypothetical protein
MRVFVPDLGGVETIVRDVCEEVDYQLTDAHVEDLVDNMMYRIVTELSVLPPVYAAKVRNGIRDMFFDTIEQKGGVIESEVDE